MSMKNIPVEIRGQKEGLYIFLNDHFDPEAVFSALEQKLASANNFFSGAEVSIYTGERQFSSYDETRLRRIVEQQYHLRIKDIHAANMTEQEKKDREPSDFAASVQQVSPNTKQPQTPETAPGAASEKEDPDDEFMKFLDETFRIPVAQRWEEKPTSTYSSDYLYENEERTFYFRGTVRSGQSLEFSGNLVVIGDVNPGAYVIASGDIIVMGRLNGVVHAGAEGEERAIVIGASFTPSQLRIAQYIGRPPDEYSHSSKNRARTEKAFVKDGGIMIEPII